MRIYNTLTHKKELFRARKDRKIQLFVCGPTVYDLSHLGHARTYLFFDMFVNFLKIKGYKVYYLQNITDIDNKVIKRAKEKKITPKELARKFEKEYLKDMKSLKIDTITRYAKATDYIPEIISQVRRLIKRGYAYKIKDGIYYDIKKFKDYGRLSQRTILQAEDAISRIDESIEKRNKGDFCLWKFSKKGEPKWKSPWGYGRPGWHIEDTAITEEHFGPQYDIHGGARDLIFPHHEAEIAQMEALSGKKPMVKYWMHTGFLTVNGKKMSKSLGNFITIRDFLKKYSPESLRIFFLTAHYRSPINFQEKGIREAEKNLERLEEFYSKIEKRVNYSSFSINNKFLKRYLSFLNDDFNTPAFLSALFKLVRNKNKRIKSLNQRELKDIKGLLIFINKIFKIFRTKKVVIPQKVLVLVRKREIYRQNKMWKEADEIRKEIKKMGFQIKDKKEGTEIEPLRRL